MKKILILSLPLMLLVALSCKKKKTEDVTPSKVCGDYLSYDSSIYTGSTNATVVMYYIYNNNNKLIRRDYYTPGTSNKIMLDSLFYSQAGKIDSIVQYDYPALTLTGRKRIYTYSGSNLTQIVAYGSSTDTYTFSYTGNTLTGATFPLDGNTAVVSNIQFTDGNLTSADLDPDGAGSTYPFAFPVTITYDDKKNYARDLQVSTDVFQLFSRNNYLIIHNSLAGNLVTNDMTYNGKFLVRKQTSNTITTDTQDSSYEYEERCK